MSGKRKEKATLISASPFSSATPPFLSLAADAISPLFQLSAMRCFHGPFAFAAAG